ncbi:uncharacterized protein LOC8281296 isoform X2 [Ricinus communis]|nr:uncharacterized protein LOC8281296 isoform X2 [Ricinus communis]|eukprot:XP_015583144.1 uncharacterized protein LOC8281296 isoform X2 [Ricinus communis]
MLKSSGRSSIMRAIKGGWAGQTFALAKRNESGGRKSRIRISKEERKEMVESFIKKHQSLNNGNFPSLNLTHKEVGGSFYTIREIVREIIQENKVLGPAKSLPEEQNSDKLFIQYPLGTISSEPEASPFMSPNGSAFLSDRHEDTSEEEPYLISKGLLHQGFDNGKIINVNVVPAKKESDETKVAMDQVSELPDIKKHMEEAVASISELPDIKKQTEEAVASRSKVTQMADVIVETFPLQPLTQPTYNLDERSSEVRGLNGILAEKDVEKAPLGPVYNTSLSDGMNLSDNSSVVDDRVENLAGSLLEGESKSVHEKAVKNIADLQLGNSNSFAAKDIISHDTLDDKDVEVKSSYDDIKDAEKKVVNAANGTQTKTPNGTHANTESSKPIYEQKVIQNKADVQQSGSSQKDSTPTLERIKIESWGGASRKPTKSETNPVVAAFKSFVASFVKFWSG